ncbi:response regulator [Thioclava sp. IC9]|uniref:response regulator n=1 Tax=Thioclava sp. IC9 TaxID=1973007 RepID=UPI0011321200|nr:response regulator [Thioclava sp. IC9]
MTLCAPPRIDGTALVLEDAMIVAYDAAAMLSEFGARDVVIFGTVDEALQHIAGGNDISMALLDINLGDETSLEAAKALRERAVPILYSTGYDEKSMMMDGFPEGKILIKPFTDDDFAQALISMGFVEA